MWKNIVERDRPQMTIRRMRIACWKTKAINTYKPLGSVILIAFAPRLDVLRHTYIAYLVYIKIILILQMAGIRFVCFHFLLEEKFGAV
jgi:hypothetical protein